MADGNFDMQTAITVLERMQDEFLENTQDSEVSAIEGTFAFDALSANATEFEKAYAEMSLMIEAAFADTSWGKFLTMRAAEFGVDRKPATKAIGVLTITGNKGVRVPAGSLFDVDDDTQFTTNEACVIGQDGTVDVRITCTTAGDRGNVGAGTINHIPVSIYGVKSCSNAAPTYDGYDEESDKALLKRYLVVVRTPATSGNKYHYYNWAMSIAGVGGCRVLPLWDGPGTVKVLVVDSNMQIASHETVQAVADYIESVRPIGADVTVVSPVPKTLDITMSVAGIFDEDVFREELTAYLKDKNLDLRYISASQVIDIIMNQSGVSDCDNVMLNGGNKVIVSEDELLSVGEVTADELDT
jgi:uncharacterized phage protein gp47/JayE